MKGLTADDRREPRARLTSRFDDELASSRSVERLLLWKELAALAVVVVVVVVRQLWCV